MDIFKLNLTKGRKLQLLQQVAIYTVIYASACLIFGDTLKQLLLDPLFLFMIFSNLTLIFKYCDYKDKYRHQTLKVYFGGLTVFLVIILAKLLIQ